MDTMPASTSWHLLIPVKGGPRAKSRLRAPDGVDHGSLATALALDTVSAAAAEVTAQRIVVVTSDPGIAGRVTAAGIHVVPDPGSGLNAAILAGLGDLRRRRPDGPTGVLLGDLPAVRPVDLGAALDAASQHQRSFVPDTEDSGTVLLTGSTPSVLQPHFGVGSAAAHERAGYARLDLDLPHLRTDVDDEESLRAVLCLGVGVHTARLLANLMATDSRQVHDRGREPQRRTGSAQNGCAATGRSAAAPNPE